jgi:large subunit ribosomal protein L10
MAQEVKELMVKELAERFHDIRETGCVLVGYQGMKADEARRLREGVQQQGARMMVIKNTLFGLALDRLGASEVRSLLAGPTAVVQAENPVVAARAVKEMAEACEAIQVLGGYVEGRIADAAGVEKLARIPSREVLLSQVAGALMAPLRRLAFGLLAKPRSVMSVLSQLKDRAEPEEAAAPE